ncbi:MAG TPA: M28 family peptidase [Puia sp.]|nr:M28 family peptidase [Puia sp.]
MSNCIDLIKQLDKKSNDKRRQIIVDCLKEYGVDYRVQEYATGTNLVVDLGEGDRRIGVGSHFDRVPEAPGANDNGSAIAVCIEIIKTFQERGNKEMGLRIFFFDEEETGLKGSSAFTRQYGVDDMAGLINLELVGIGDKIAIWPVDQDFPGKLLETFEQCAKNKNIWTRRFDKIIANTADHLSFRRAGLADAFTLTCISDKDIEAAGRYYEAMARGADTATLSMILSQAPVFKNYHQAGDSYDKIEERAILMTSSVVWDTIITG